MITTPARFPARWIRVALLSVPLLAAREAVACATCFGQTDSALGQGLNWGIFTLLVVVGMVLAGICSFFVFVARRAARLEAEAGPDNGVAPAAGDSSHTKTV